MGAPYLLLRRAMERMSGEKEFETISKKAVEVQVGDKFKDVNGAVYSVRDIKLKKGVYCVYAVTDSDNPDGWFTREEYDVIIEYK